MAATLSSARTTVNGVVQRIASAVPSEGRIANAVPKVHERIFRATNGRVLGRAAGMPVVMLTTTGRKSGQPRTTMLTSPVQDGDQIVLVASMGGSDKHPAWYLNLRDNPEVHAVMSGRNGKMIARTATAEEKRELWPRVVAKYKGYAGYQEKTDRDIPLVLLTPAPTA